MGKVIPFFTEHPLIGKKGKDYALWKEAVSLLYAKKKKLKGGGGAEKEMRLKEIYAAMREYKAVYANKPLREALFKAL
jgi:hypothetical protein